MNPSASERNRSPLPLAGWPNGKGNRLQICKIAVRVRVPPPYHCSIAQQVERLTVNQDVTGSSPVGAAKLIMLGVA